MTTLDIILEHKALFAFLAISCIAVIAVATRSDHLSDDWLPVDGFEIKISPMTALVGCLSIVLLDAIFGSSALIGNPAN